MKWLNRIFKNTGYRKSLRNKYKVAKNPNTENVGKDLIVAMKEDPVLEDFLKNSIKKYGNEPFNGIINDLINEKFSEEAKISASLMISHIGAPAIPKLIDLLGKEYYSLAMFAAKTLPNIEGSLPHLIDCLKSENLNVRTHAAGSLQYFGLDAIPTIPILCEFIKTEITSSGIGNDVTKLPESVGNATGALGKMGEAALPELGKLLDEENVAARFCAVAALSRIGKPAIQLLKEKLNIEKDPRMINTIENTIKSIEH